MSDAASPTSADVLKSLKLLRSGSADERRQAIEVLSHVTDDPRVLQVFDYLYQTDPDPGVREAIWQVLSRRGPSVPAPSPRTGHRTPRTPTPGVTFLLNPANRALVRQHMSRGAAPAPRGSRALSLLMGVLLLAAGFLGGLAAPAWNDWFRLRQDGVATQADIIGLSAPVAPGSGGTHTVAYRFRLSPANENADAPEFFGEQRISADLHAWLAATRPSTVSILYLRDDPTRSRLDAETPDDTRRERLAILAGGAAAIALLVGVLNWIVRLPGRGTLRGRLLRGQIIAAQTRLEPDGRRRLTVRFRFLSPARRPITSEASRLRSDLLPGDLPEPGTPVLIEYHSDRQFRLL